MACVQVPRLRGQLQGNPNAEADLYAHLTSDDVSKMPDGDTGYHKCIRTENPERIRNMVRWILDQ